MYFNRRVLFASFMIGNCNLVEAGDCNQSFVKAASDAGFLEYALIHCLPKGQSETENSLNEPALDAQS